MYTYISHITPAAYSENMREHHHQRQRETGCGEPGKNKLKQNI